jgi:ankyrin repeat protein
MLDLLQYGADVIAEGSDGGTALMTAIGKGQALVVKCMLRHGVEVHNASHDKFHKPLLTAVMRGHLSVVKVLLEAGVQELGCSEVAVIERMLRHLDDDSAVAMLRLLLQHWGTEHCVRHES